MAAADERPPSDRNPRPGEKSPPASGARPGGDAPAPLERPSAVFRSRAVNTAANAAAAAGQPAGKTPSGTHPATASPVPGAADGGAPKRGESGSLPTSSIPTRAVAPPSARNLSPSAAAPPPPSAAPAEPAGGTGAAGKPEESAKRRSLPRLQCKKCGIVYSGALPKAQRCMECESPLVDADPPPAPNIREMTANDTAPPTARAVGSPLLWAPGSSKRSELLVTRYLIRDPTTDILGSGAKGVVYRAEDRRMGNRPVAIKLFFDDAADDLEAEREQSRTEREIRIQALLTHPAIVTAHDRFESPHGSGIVLEYIDGQSLEERVRKKGPLPVREAARVALEVAKAAEFMHEKSIIHRDLKPANILLTRDGNVKVIDFGVAKHKEDKSEKDRLRVPLQDKPEDVVITRDGSIVGTPSYMSPEQALGRVAWVDERSDIYGVGAILYFATTGKPPFAGDDVEAILDRVRKLPPPPPSTWNDKIDKPLEAIIDKALRKLPEHRFQNAGDMVEQLRRYLDGEQLDTSVYLEPLHRRAVRAAVAHQAATGAVVAAIVAFFVVLGGMIEYGRYREEQNLDQRIERANEQLHALNVNDAIALYNEILVAHPGNPKALSGQSAAYKAQVHVELYKEGKRLLEDAKRAADRGDDAELLYENAYRRLWDARAHGSPAADLDELLKRAQGIAHLEVQRPVIPDGAARLKLVQLSDDDLSEAKLALDTKLPTRAQELPTGLYQGLIEAKGLGEPLYFPIKIARGTDVSVEAIPAPWPEMVYVRGHPHFRPGHPRHDDLEPQAVEPFFIDRDEVTVGEYRQFLQSIQDPALRKRRTPAHWSELSAPEPADWPVTNISFDDAQAYAAFRGKDLPTEAQWQLAASGGLDDRDYPYGRRYIAVYGRTQGLHPDAVGTHRHDRSPFGVYDMGGNVSELVKGFFDAEGTLHLAKGGSYAKKAPVWERLPVPGPDRSIGFRCARPTRSP